MYEFQTNQFISELLFTAEITHQTPYDVVLILEKDNPIAPIIREKVLQALSGTVCEVPYVPH